MQCNMDSRDLTTTLEIVKLRLVAKTDLLFSVTNHLFDFIASLDLESHAYFEVGRKIQRPLFIVGGRCRRLRSPNPDRSLNPDHAVL